MNKTKLNSAHNRILNYLMIYIILFFPFLSITAQSWQPQSSGIGNALMSVFFTDQSNGWIAGGFGTILHTTDSGENWNQQNSGTNENLNCVFFLDTLKGWICGSEGTILQTTDGGSTWSTQNSFTILNLLSVCFVNDSTGWVSGNNGIILKTTNGGSDWLPQDSQFSGYIADLEFISADYGLAAAYASGAITSTILKTTNGGDNWQVVTVSGLPPWPVFSIDFVDSSTGWVVGFIEVIFKSTDGGNTWTEQQGVSSTPEGFLSVSFADENNGWTVGYYGIIAHTTNGGDLWTAETSGTSENLWNVCFVNETLGWAVGDNGTILRYGNPVVQVMNGSNATPPEYILLNNYPNPFNPVTKIKYEIPERSFITIKVYDVLGNEVVTLLNEEKSPGNYEIEFTGKGLTSGIYFYKLQAENFISVKKMILLK